MGTFMEVGDPVTLVGGVPEGLVARRIQTVVENNDGTRRVRTDRRGRIKVEEVALVAAGDPQPPEQVIARFGHRRVRDALGASSRTRTRRGLADESLAVALAEAGLVELRAPVAISAGGLVAKPFTRWVRTSAGSELAAGYQLDERPEGPLGRFMLEAADISESPDPAGWRAVAVGANQRARAAIDRAVQLTASGTAAGWPLSRFAREVTGHTKGLGPGAPLAGAVVEVLAAHFEVPEPSDDEEGSRAEWRSLVFAAAGLGVDALASQVVCVGLPAGGSGPAGRLLATAQHDGLPVVVPRVRLAADPYPVGAPPPRSPGWVFAVENEALLSFAWRDAPGVPVVWSGSVAALGLLQACEAAGWRVAVSADFEQGGLNRAAWLLVRLETAVAWRLSANDYERHLTDGSGDPLSSRKVVTPWDERLGKLVTERRVRITEEDRFEVLANDLKTGRPTYSKKSDPAPRGTAHPLIG